MKNLGFTLVELLGVIIIIGALVTIIAISISGVLDNSETKLTQIQIDKVEEAAKNYYINEGMVSSDFDENEFSHCVSVNYLIENGYIDDNEVKNFETGEDILGSVKISYNSKKYNYTYQEKTCGICTPVTNNTKTTGNIPIGRYNPGDEYICEVKEDVEYHFFVLSTEGNNVNLILDRNINSDGTLVMEKILPTEPIDGVYNIVPWISAQDYSDNTVSGKTCGEAACSNLPPITAINFINEATKNWNNINNLNEIYSDEKKDRNWEIELTGKARLPKLAEVESVGCSTKNLTGDEEKGSCPLWLVNYLNSSSFVTGNNVKNIDDLNGYWTLSSGYSSSAHSISSDAWAATITVYLNRNGIRPVITLTKETMEIKDRR